MKDHDPNSSSSHTPAYNADRDVWQAKRKASMLARMRDRRRAVQVPSTAWRVTLW